MKKHYTLDISTHILTKRMTKRCRKLFMQVWYFNSHPHEEDDDLLEEAYVTIAHFNSHPHEEDDSIVVTLVVVFILISTHILTKRMTQMLGDLESCFGISTHILTKRMTIIGISNSLTELTFQLTSSRRG